MVKKFGRQKKTLPPNFCPFFVFNIKIYIIRRKNMKRLAAIILSTIILFSFAACDISSGTDKETDSTPSTTDEEIDQPAHANPEHFANFSSYDDIIRTYKAIVKCFDHYTVEEYRNNEYKS
jgi:hypothetical protein